MTRPVSDIAFTPAVKAWQARLGSRDAYARMEEGRGWKSAVTEELAAFIAQRDSFYLGTASADGQPYIQHRGGPKGFLQVLDDRTLAFADYAGNRQYITAGNLTENPKAYIFLMDYANRRRIKIWGRAEIVEGDEQLLGELHSTEYPAQPERAIRFRIEAWDGNCPQHIVQRYTAEDIGVLVDDLQARIAELEHENAALRRAAQDSET